VTSKKEQYEASRSSRAKAPNEQINDSVDMILPDHLAVESRHSSQSQVKAHSEDPLKADHSAKLTHPINPRALLSEKNLTLKKATNNNPKTLTY